MASIEEMSVEQLLGRIRAGDHLDLIDARRPAEWNAGHIAEARLLPLNRLAASLDNLDRAGFGRLSSVTGGFNAWTALIYPVTL